MIKMKRQPAAAGTVNTLYSIPLSIPPHTINIIHGPSRQLARNCRNQTRYWSDFRLYSISTGPGYVVLSLPNKLKFLGFITEIFIEMH